MATVDRMRAGWRRLVANSRLIAVVGVLILADILAFTLANVPTADRFRLWAGTGLVVLVEVALVVGWATRKLVLGVLIDNRDRYSLTHLQVVLWTTVILSSVIGVGAAKGLAGLPSELAPELLALMGIAGGSAVLTTAVKASKDTLGATARVARLGKVERRNGTTKNITRRFAQIWMEEEGDLADEVVSITKYQSLLFTALAVVLYVIAAWAERTVPELPGSVLTLLGISQGAYVGGKVPDKG
jgi:hypothetical protein